MPMESFIALVVLATASLYTPGPNNAMLAASGARFGPRATFPHMQGVALGFAAMALIVALFLGQIYQNSAVLREVLRYGGAALLLWVAWQIAWAGEFRLTKGAPRPMRFVEAAAFQWINPKAWAMATAIGTQFVSPEAPYRTAGIVFLVFAVMGQGSALLWTGLGQSLARWLTSELRRTAFNLFNASLIVISVIAILMS